MKVLSYEAPPARKAGVKVGSRRGAGAEAPQRSEGDLMASVVVFCEAAENGIRAASLPALTAGARLAEQTKGSVVAVVVGSGIGAAAQDAARYASKVIAYDDPKLASQGAARRDRRAAAGRRGQARGRVGADRHGHLERQGHPAARGGAAGRGHGVGHHRRHRRESIPPPRLRRQRDRRGRGRRRGAGRERAPDRVPAPPRPRARPAPSRTRPRATSMRWAPRSWRCTRRRARARISARPRSSSPAAAA